MAFDNPYSPPEALLTEPPRPVSDADLASQSQRFANFLIDRVTSFGLTFLFGIASYALGYDLSEIGRLQDLALSSGIALLYFFVAEGSSGRTLGKLITGTRVVAESGGSPSISQVLGRSLARFVPFEPFSFLGSGPFVGWHDSWSRTRVIRTRGAH